MKAEDRDDQLYRLSQALKMLSPKSPLFRNLMKKFKIIKATEPEEEN